ncbi:hypothetical protein Pelo_10112 [Pelomyxa schiedti]|nr:hypothetical protein Pelo_10112 [Pelomyxa schiedti]
MQQGGCGCGSATVAVVRTPRGTHVSLDMCGTCGGDGRSGRATVGDVKRALWAREGVPVGMQRLSGVVSGAHGGVGFCADRARDLDDLEVLCSGITFLSLDLRICGGKQGAFGQSLRGQHTRPGTKRTTNFDSCRTLDGRRLRHVKKEQQLVGWYQQKIEDATKPKPPPTKELSEEEKRRQEKEAKAQLTVNQWLVKELETSESIFDAVEQGLAEEAEITAATKAALAKKLSEDVGKSSKRRRIWDDIEEDFFAPDDRPSITPLEEHSDDEDTSMPPPPAEHEKHPHPLTLKENQYGPDYSTECDICGVQTHKKTYHCAECKFDACQRCYLLFYSTPAVSSTTTSTSVSSTASTATPGTESASTSTTTSTETGTATTTTASSASPASTVPPKSAELSSQSSSSVTQQSTPKENP